MKYPVVIGILGNARAGKDTIARYLSVKFSVDLLSNKRVAFADPIRDMANSLLHNYGIEPPIDENKNMVIPALGVSYRYLCQTLGTDWGRNMVGSSIWLNALYAKVKLNSPDVVLIPDVRFKNEADYLRTHFKNVYLIKVFRSGSNLDSNPSHASEAEVNSIHDVDFTIDNNGTVEELHRKLDSIYSHLP
jgi:hypothetical protein